MAQNTGLKDLFNEIRSLIELGNQRDYTYTARMDRFETYLKEMKTVVAEISKEMKQARIKLPTLTTMAAKLTHGVIKAMCRDDFSCEDIKPVLQVIDLRVVRSQQQHGKPERYRLALSDGSHYQQGMLYIKKNELVHAGILQKGSIVKLTQFICNVLQSHKFIYIIELDVVLDRCDIIGKPVAAPRVIPASSSTDQYGATTVSPQSSLAGGNIARPNVFGPSLDDFDRIQQPLFVYSRKRRCT